MNDSIVLDIRDLKSHFFTAKGEVPAVDGVSIEVPAGKIIGIVGESGCGKSMTAMSVMGLLRYPGKVVGGSITLEGRDITHLSPRELAKVRGNEISMIFQEPMTALNPVFRIGDQVDEVLALHNEKGHDEAQIKARTIELLEMVGIANSEGVYKMFPHELSGGMRQRVMIAMALACSPKLIIADEPTTALDVTIQAQILDLLRNLKDQINSSIMFITHDLGVIAEMADYVVVMYAGRIVEQGTAEEVMERPRHPYTAGLIHSLPSRGMVPIPPPDPGRLEHTGCPFYPRCPRAMERCGREAPGEVALPTGGKVRCFLYE